MTGGSIIGTESGTGIQIADSDNISSNNLIEMISQNFNILTSGERLEIKQAVNDLKQNPDENTLKTFLDKSQSMFSSVASITTTAKSLWGLLTKTNN